MQRRLHLSTTFLFILYISQTAHTTTVSNSRFLYSHAPVQLVEEARSIGEYEKQVFHTEVDKLKDNGLDKLKNMDTEMELYSKHLLSCSSVGQKLSHHLVHAIGDQATPLEENSAERKTHEVLKTVGFDDVAIRMFLLPADKIKSLIRTACLKHELQFQCADAFLNNSLKIRNNIERMKAADGNVKVMFEKECTNDEEVNVPEIYSCIGSSADEVHASCGATLSVFNKSRERLNQQISIHYNRALELSEAEDNQEQDAKDEQEDEAEETYVHTIDSSISQIRILEGFRCRIYAQLERCATNTIAEQCGHKSRSIVKTLLRVGHLRRERGDQMHQHLFVDNEIVEHPACSPYV
ncbi:hypothetical protein M3Y97_00353100 [Aphelenchoides bicaudatus]|nr:hypothetical protein M3Y97_00353100 [Aphelenchoides bicaudatus]